MLILYPYELSYAEADERLQTKRRWEINLLSNLDTNLVPEFEIPFFHGPRFIRGRCSLFDCGINDCFNTVTCTVRDDRNVMFEWHALLIPTL
jgi:hypothetical protein